LRSTLPPASTLSLKAISALASKKVGLSFGANGL
jgi:hypothetical protein